MGTQPGLTPEQKLAAEREQRRKHLRELYNRVRERVGRSRLELSNKDPNFSYYFGNKNPDEMAKYSTLGFEVDKDPKVAGSSPRGADGTLQIGDLILLRMPREEYEILLECNRLQSQENIDAAIERLVAEAERMKVPVFTTGETR